MITVPGGWKVNLTEMACKNTFTKMEVEFVKNRKGFCGKIKYMPMDLLEKYATEPFGDYYIREAIMGAQIAFLRAYYINDMKKAA
jgi:hypothetical protein